MMQNTLPLLQKTRNQSLIGFIQESCKRLTIPVELPEIRTIDEFRRLALSNKDGSVVIPIADIICLILMESGYFHQQFIVSGAIVGLPLLNKPISRVNPSLLDIIREATFQLTRSIPIPPVDTIDKFYRLIICNKNDDIRVPLHPYLASILRKAGAFV